MIESIALRNYVSHTSIEWNSLHETSYEKRDKMGRVKCEKIVEISRKGYTEKLRRRGRSPKLSIENLPLATLRYQRKYRTYARIAADYGIAESTICQIIKWVEDTLIRDGRFKEVARC